MEQNNEEDVLDYLHKYINVACEDDHNHCYEYDDGQVLQRFLEYVGYLREILSAEDTEYERNTHNDEDALEDVSERNHKLRELADVMVSCKVEIKLSPECEVKRCREHADRCVECSQ